MEVCVTVARWGWRVLSVRCFHPLVVGRCHLILRIFDSHSSSPRICEGVKRRCKVEQTVTAGDMGSVIRLKCCLSPFCKITTIWPRLIMKENTSEFAPPDLICNAVSGEDFLDVCCSEIHQVTLGFSGRLTGSILSLQELTTDMLSFQNSSHGPPH